MRCISLKVHIIELIGKDEALRTLARLKRAEFVIFHILFVNDFSAKVDVFQLLLLHLIVLFLCHDADVVVCLDVCARILGSNIVHGAVEGLLLILAVIMHYFVQVEV